MHPIVADNLDAIRALCQEYGVARLEIFGSAATPDFDPARSDIDFLVEYPPDYDYGPWLGRLHELEAALASLLRWDVDLVMTTALRKERFRLEAAKTQTEIYHAPEVSDVA